MPKTQPNTDNKPLRTLAELKNDADNQLKKILTQGKNIKEFKSNIDILVKRYHTNDSFLDNLANSYGKLQWWLKLGIMISIVSVSACIGIACNLVIVLAVVSFVLYASLVLILENHHSAILKKDEMFAKDIAELEESLAESVEHINGIENSLEIVFTSLYELNFQQAEDIEAFEAQIEKLEEQINQLIELNGNLDSTKDMLFDSTQKIAVAFTKAKISLSDLTSSLSINAGELNDTNQQLLSKITEFLKTQESLQKLSDSFGEDHTTLTTMIAELHKLLNRLKIHADATETINNEVLKKLTGSAYNTLATKMNTDLIISEADSSISEAIRLLDNYKTDPQDVERNAEFKQRSRETKAVLERAANLLTSINSSQEPNPISLTQL